MPVTAIPFKAPAPFNIPPRMADPIRSSSALEAAAKGLDMLAHTDAGAAMAVSWLDGENRLGAGAVLAPGGNGSALADLNALRQQSPAVIAADSDFMARAIATNGPLLYMGEASAADAALFPAPFLAYLLGGAASAAVGFLYVFPLASPGQAARGALMIHRPLADGPLNHDQPAIAHAVSLLLGEVTA